MKAEDKQAVLDLLIAQAGTNKQDRVRINILVSPELRDTLKIIAKSIGVSMNEFITTTLEENSEAYIKRISKEIKAENFVKPEAPAEPAPTKKKRKTPEASESEYDLVTPIINSREKSY